MGKQIGLEMFQTRLIEHIAVALLLHNWAGKKEMLNDTNYFPLINMIDCQSLTWRGEGEKCVKGKFAQTSLVFLHLKINQRRLGSLILSFVYLMGCCRIYGCN